MLGVTFEERDWLRARKEFAAATAAAPDNDVLFYNLGLIYRRDGLIDDALAAFRRSDAINPRHLAAHSRPHAADRIAELEAEQQRLEAIEAQLARDSSLGATRPGTPAYHQQLATLLEGRGEAVAARGHRLRAIERAAGA
jgi:tetratricopeptide (TPR) repeat protein